jgi:hypothetical protein
MSERVGGVRARRRRDRQWSELEEDPLQGFANLFDVAMVLAVALLLAVELSMAIRASGAAAATPEQPGEGKDQVRPEATKALKRHRVSRERAQGKGDRLGTAYRLESGEVVYVPEDARALEAAEAAPPRSAQ